MKMSIVVWVVALLSPTVPCLANNNFFLPGDAFFHAVLTEEDLKALRANEDATFDYVYVAPGSFCGNAGYERLTVKQLPAGFLRNLEYAYRLVRTNVSKEVRIEEEFDFDTSVVPTRITPRGERKEIETNGISILFYSTDFDLTRFEVALKYNETWPAELAAFGHEGPQARLDEFVPTMRGVVESWRNAHRVAPLPVKLPDTRPTRGEAIAEPIILQTPVRAIVLPDQKFETYFGMEEGATIYDISVDELKCLTAGQGAWERTKTPLFQPPGRLGGTK